MCKGASKVKGLGGLVGQYPGYYGCVDKYRQIINNQQVVMFLAKALSVKIDILNNVLMVLFASQRLGLPN